MRKSNKVFTYEDIEKLKILNENIKFLKQRRNRIYGQHWIKLLDNVPKKDTKWDEVTRLKYHSVLTQYMETNKISLYRMAINIGINEAVYKRMSKHGISYNSQRVIERFFKKNNLKIK